MLLSLPLELREQIYSDVLSHASHSPHILRTCREVYTEARKFLFQRPISFRSQSALYRWLEGLPQQLLQHVTEISLEVEDVDLRPLLSSFASTAGPGESMPRLLAWQLYESELENLRQAFGQLENVRIFTLRAISGRQSFLYREFLGEMLEMLSSVYPGLLDLRLIGNFHYQRLDFLRLLQELRSFSFDGFSASSPNEMSVILSGVPNLTNISIVSQHTMLTPTNHQQSTFTSRRQSLTDQVIRSMNCLSSFSISETMQPASFPALFFTSDILSSLHTHTALAHLSITLSQSPEDEALEALEAFLEKSSIQRLELDWSDFNPGVLETYALLPNCLQEFRVRATCMASAFDILWPILEGREQGDVQYLSRIVLVRGEWERTESTERMDDVRMRDVIMHDDHPAADDSDEDNFARAKRRLNALGVVVLWSTETS